MHKERVTWELDQGITPSDMKLAALESGGSDLERDSEAPRSPLPGASKPEQPRSTSAENENEKAEAPHSTPGENPNADDTKLQESEAEESKPVQPQTET